MTLKETSKYTLELHVIGVLKEYQRNKLGSKLFSYALEYAKENNYEFMQVKTVATGYYKEYDLTNKFYQNIEFKELEVITSIWDEANPCQIYVMSIK
jgi:GNAT superfamily N-acetyltransferase